MSRWQIVLLVAVVGVSAVAWFAFVWLGIAAAGAVVDLLVRHTNLFN